MYIWVKEISNFWIHVLKRNYTMDTHRRELITDAGRFLADCMMPLEPEAIPRIGTQMRRFMKEENLSAQ